MDVTIQLPGNAGVLRAGRAAHRGIGVVVALANASHILADFVGGVGMCDVACFAGATAKSGAADSAGRGDTVGEVEAWREDVAR